MIIVDKDFITLGEKNMKDKINKYAYTKIKNKGQLQKEKNHCISNGI